MENLQTTLNQLDGRQRLLIAAATIAALLAIGMVARFATTPTQSLLYSQLDSRSAGEVLSTLDAQGVAYTVRGSSIYVDGAMRDRLRLSLASDGLPSASSDGYELLERATGFGTTSQMFDATYWRAKEGELARTISSGVGIRSARVHIARESGQRFARSQSGSASVTITPNGAPINRNQAHAIQFLVASAVPNLSPVDVSVIDAGTGQLINGPSSMTTSANQSDRELALKQGVERMLAARLGPNRAVVEVAIEMVRSEETVLERSIDPNSRTVISTETVEKSSQSDGSTASVTVASNLPDGDADGRRQSAQDNETHERVNYQISETERQVKLAPGAVQRMTVAVLVDGIRNQNPDGTQDWISRSPDEMASLKSLVEAAVGYNSQRGDVVTIEVMEFEGSPVETGSLSAQASLISNYDIVRLLATGLLVVASLVALKMVLRALSASKSQRVATDSVDISQEGDTIALPDMSEISEQLSFPPMATVEDIEIPIENNNGKIAIQNIPGLPSALLDENESEEEDPIQKLRDLIRERQDETIEILRGWMEEKEEDA